VQTTARAGISAERSYESLSDLRGALDVAQHLHDRAAAIRGDPTHTLVRQPSATSGASSIAEWSPLLDNNQIMLYTIDNRSLLDRAASDIFGRSGFWFGSPEQRLAGWSKGSTEGM
jgi:hypothetical protein